MRRNWEIVKGCEQLTEGCNSCPSYAHYAEHGLDYTASPFLQNLGVPTDDQFSKIYTVALGSDLFHESVSIPVLQLIFDTLNRARHHCFEITTKRIERAYCVSKELQWTENIWLGTSVESGEYLWRMDYLNKIPANYKIISACPILGAFPSNMDLSGIDQFSVIEETWGLKRPAKQNWIDDIERQCKDQEVEFNMSGFQLWRAN
jgi:protein gp37